MNIFKVAWLAGIVDGEGCITARVSPAGFRFIPTVAVGMTHLETMHEVQRIVHDLTGRKYRLYQWQDKQHHKTCYKIMVGRKAAVVKLLEAMLPILVTKRRQAELLLRLASAPHMYHGRGPAKQYEPWVADVVAQIRTLNHRGIANEAPTGERRETEPSAHQEEETVHAA
ncbi:MAG: hypothetical protein WC683_07210 [bacterium]